MTAGAEKIALLERAVDQMGRVIAAIRPEQSSLPTPCPGWDVRALVRHVIGQNLRNFTVAARGEDADWRAEADELPPDWTRAFRQGAEVVLDVWRNAELQRPVKSVGGQEGPLHGRADQQIAELSVHSWDLARATGQDIELDPELAEHSLAWSRRMLRPEFRGPDRAFGAEVPVPADAPVYDRLAGWFGRDPGWTPS